MDRSVGIVLIATALLVSATGCAAATISLDDSPGGHRIVLPGDRSPSEYWAATELAGYLKKMGTSILVETAPATLPRKAIYVGFGPETEKLGVRTDMTLGGEGYIIRTVGDNIVIAGGKKRGTMYGVFTFLEKLGVRWWTPTETFVPLWKTIRVLDTNTREIPKLEYRDMMYPEIFPSHTEQTKDDPSKWDRTNQVWAAHNKVNGMAWDEAPESIGGWYEVSGNLVHSYASLMRNSGLPLADDMWALRPGGRRAVGRQPCFANPATLKAMVAGAVAEYRANPDIEFVVVGQEDNSEYCTCDACKAVCDREEALSGMVIDFANRVAGEVVKTVPNAKILTAAYEWSRKPPKTIRPRDNVYIVLCSIECSFSHPLSDVNNPSNKPFKDDIEGWGKLAKKLFIWHYCGNRVHYLMPNPDLTTFVPNTKFLSDNRAVGVFVQGTHVGEMTEFTPLRMWLWSKALWNPDGDGRKYIEEFCNGYYGAAGPAVMKYINVIHAVALTEEFHSGRRAYLNAPYLRPEVMAEGAAALWDAMAKVKGDPVLEKRVRHARMPLLYVLFKRGMMSRTWPAVEAKVGRLDPEALAAEFKRVVAENNINYTADPEDIAPWVEWMTDYAQAMAQKKGKIVPPELESADPSTYRVIQACQWDGRSRWWERFSGASDGWCLSLPAGAQMNSFVPSPYEDFVPGKTYQYFFRARAAEIAKPGVVFTMQLNSSDPTVRVKTRRSVKSEEIKPGEWQVFAGPKWTFDKSYSFSFECTRDVSPEAYLDCVWLVEVQ